MIVLLRNGLLGLLVVLTAAANAPAAGPLRDLPPDRNAVWRAIFARPAGLPGAPPDAAEVALGQALFHDARLSGNGRASCASCHHEALAFTDGRPTAQGPGGAELGRNVPPLFDLAWSKAFFWDGRAASLEAQARFPIVHPDELGGDFEVIVARLAADPTTAAQFASAFPQRPEVSEEGILTAIAAYERSLVSPRTRFDAWVAGVDTALDETEQKGFSIFVGKGGCVACHGGWRFTDDALHDIGLDARDLVLAKTPSLRELTRTAPYMHDGSKATLMDVIDHYAGELKVRPTLANTINRNLSLTFDEKNALEAFLKTLSSMPRPINKQ